MWKRRKKQYRPLPANCSAEKTSLLNAAVKAWGRTEQGTTSTVPSSRRRRRPPYGEEPVALPLPPLPLPSAASLVLLLSWPPVLLPLPLLLLLLPFWRVLLLPLRRLLPPPLPPRPGRLRPLPPGALPPLPDAGRAALLAPPSAAPPPPLGRDRGAKRASAPPPLPLPPPPPARHCGPRCSSILLLNTSWMSVSGRPLWWNR
jgi:hypothetical protein